VVKVGEKKLLPKGENEIQTNFVDVFHQALHNATLILCMKKSALSFSQCRRGQA
jgi:hypothetical protein